MPRLAETAELQSCLCQAARQSRLLIVKRAKSSVKDRDKLSELPMIAALEDGGVTVWFIKPCVSIARAIIDRHKNRLKRVCDRSEIGRPSRFAIRDMQVERQKCLRENALQCR